MESLSCNNEIRVSDSDSAESVDCKVAQLKQYLIERIEEIENRISKGSRSIFDFADMAIVISVLSEVAGRQDASNDGDRFKKFVREYFFDSVESADAEVVAERTYHLLRCGLVHELSLEGHRCPIDVLSGYSLSITHDQSPQGSWFQILPGRREICFYAHELIRKLKDCVERCFVRDQEARERIVQRLKEGVGYVSERNAPIE